MHKATFLSVVLMLFLQLPVLSQTAFALLPIEAKDAPIEQAETAFNSMSDHLISSGRYYLVDRTKIEESMKEMSFQMTGAVDNENMVKLGKILAVEKLIVSSFSSKKAGNWTYSLSVIDVATSQVELTKEVSCDNYRVEDIGRLAAVEIIKNYQFLGKVLGVSGDVIVINLGKRHGLKIGDRIFVARKEIMYDDNGEVLFKENVRIGILRIVKSDEGRSQANIKFLEKPDQIVKKGDYVSIEPLPLKETVISTSPLLPNITKGDIILEDDMKKNKYLSPNYTQGNHYQTGKLNIDATNLQCCHANCFYPAPYDQLEDFIMEGDVTFVANNYTYNKLQVVFRSDGEYEKANCYTFFWSNAGTFSVYNFQLGSNTELVKYQSSPHVNRGKGTNKFRIVAYGAKFDCYLNDQFITGFEDERYEKGCVGFWVDFKSHVIIDNVKIWNIEKKK